MRSFKVTQRAVNNLAYVNAVLKFNVDYSDNYKIVEKPTIIFGGISEDFVSIKMNYIYIKICVFIVNLVEFKNFNSW